MESVVHIGTEKKTANLQCSIAGMFKYYATYATACKQILNKHIIIIL